MTNNLNFFKLGIAVIAPITIALSTEIDPNNPESVAYWGKIAELRQQTWQKSLTDDEALKDLIRMSYDESFGSYSTAMLINSMKRWVENNSDEDKIPLQRQTKVMECMVREGVVVMRKGEKGQEEQYFQAYIDIDHCILMLAVIPDYNIHQLIKECFQINNEGFRYILIMNYIQARNAEAIPFLRELIEEANLTEQSRSEIYLELGRTAEYLTRMQRPVDVEKINVFLDEMRQEQEQIFLSPYDMGNAMGGTSRPHQKTSHKTNQKFSSNKIILGVFVLFVLSALGGLAAWKIKHKKSA